MSCVFQKSILYRVASVVLCMAGISLRSNVAFAGVVIQTPVGVSPTDHFRIIFVTSGMTSATSNNIADYNAFVNQQAGGATYQGQVIQWTAIASTNAVNAYTNTSSGTNSAVYMVDGTEVASSTTRATGGLWSSSLISQPTEGIDGTNYTNAMIWTGTSGNGLEYSTSIFGGYGLGSNNSGYNPYSQMNVFSAPQVQVGIVSASNLGSSWVQEPNRSATVTPGLSTWTNTFQMYAISQELTMAPEPSTLLSAVVGLLVLTFVLRRGQSGSTVF
jgi:hypothetical protein